MGKKSKVKGETYEREIANYLKGRGYDTARRTAQYCGNTGDASDVVGLKGIHIECKHYAKKGFDYKWLAQAQHDCNENIPVVFHRVDRMKTVVTMDIDDWMNLYEKAYKIKAKKA